MQRFISRAALLAFLPLLSCNSGPSAGGKGEPLEGFGQNSGSLGLGQIASCKDGNESLGHKAIPKTVAVSLRPRTSRQAEDSDQVGDCSVLNLLLRQAQ